MNACVLYGIDFQLGIESHPGDGTLIRIDIPELEESLILRSIRYRSLAILLTLTFKKYLAKLSPVNTIF